MSVIPVPAHALRFQFQTDSFPFNTTEQIDILTEPLGQERAIESLSFAINLNCPGYNVYAIGPSGLGKHQIVEQFLKVTQIKSAIPQEWVYVYNFAEPVKPIAISFPVGQAKVFQKEIRQIIEDLRTMIPSLYDSERYRTRRDSIIKEFKDKQDDAILQLQVKAKSENAYLMTIHGGLLFAAGDKEGNILEDTDIAKLSNEEQLEITKRINRLNDELVNVVNQFPMQERQMRLRIKELNREMISNTVETLFKDIKIKYSNYSKANEYILTLIRDIIDNAKDFKRHIEELTEFREAPSPLKRYEVNVVIDHRESSGAPIVYEDNPTFMNLVGEIEHLPLLGALITDFTLIRPGALHRANEGYLVLDAEKLLISPYAWEGLKRALKSQMIKIESLGQVYSLVSTVTLKPEPIPLNCKVILIGNAEIYQALIRLDSEFSELFRITAEFDSEMARNTNNENRFIHILSSLIGKNGLRHLDKSAIRRTIEYSSRLASDAERISLDLNQLTNLLIEANAFAKSINRELISEYDIQRAIDFQFYRVKRIYEKNVEEVKRGNVLIEVSGKRIGQINALSVFEFSNTLFGHPSRITTVVRAGEGQIVDIEREVKLGGPIHSKGVLILSGFLKSHFAKKSSLSVSCSIVFEQSYSFIEGDSASLAELASLLSSLSQVPIKQSIAVTGSINQNGQVQSVGAINEKIEGFFDLCVAKGLSGEQGVIIPRSNFKNLILRKDVIDAIEQSQFSIYTVETIEDCLQILTGLSISVIYEKIEARLEEFSVINKKLEKVNSNQL